MKEKNLIFDIDGTLWDSTGLVAKGYNLQIADEGLQMPEVTPAILKTLFGKTMTEIADRLFGFIDVPERYALMERCMVREHEVLESDPCHIAFPGVVETLEKLAKDHNLYIVSKSTRTATQSTHRAHWIQQSTTLATIQVSISSTSLTTTISISM